MKTIGDDFDLSHYQICKDPKIWVLDGFLPEKLLSLVDRSLDKDLPTRIVHNEYNHATKVRMIELRRSESNGTETLFNVLTRIANVHEVDKCQRVVVSEIWGVDQDAHIDKISVASLAPENQGLHFLNLDNFERYQFTPSTVAPTFSFVINFNDVGELIFPHIDPIKAKRGRIVMFQNYFDGEERRIHPLAKHYGGYECNQSKRIVTAGILTNKTPDLTSKHTEPAALYLLNWGHEHDIKADRTPRPRFEPKDKVYIMASSPRYQWILGRKNEYYSDDLLFDGFVKKSDADSLIWSGGVPHKPVTYIVKLTRSVFTDGLGFQRKLSGKKASLLLKTPYKRNKDDLFESCGNLCTELLVNLMLSSYIGLEPEESTGWICACVHCTPPPEGAPEQLGMNPILTPMLRKTRQRIIQMWQDKKLIKV